MLQSVLKFIGIAFLVLLCVYIIYYILRFHTKITSSLKESFSDSSEGNDDYNEENPAIPRASNANGNETFKPVVSSSSDAPYFPKDCYPKDQLTAEDLLPKDTNSVWAQVNPAGQGDLKDKNFLEAGYHIGINTIGQSLRNANYQLRSEPPNPQVKVSPWLQTTIEPDTNRRPLEIGA